MKCNVWCPLTNTCSYSLMYAITHSCMLSLSHLLSHSLTHTCSLFLSLRTLTHTNACSHTRILHTYIFSSLLSGGIILRLNIHCLVARLPAYRVTDNWTFNRLAENFFTSDSEKRNTVEERLNGQKTSLKLWSTLSSFLFFSVLTVPFICTKLGRQMYLQLLFYGSLGSYGWLAIRNVCWIYF